MLCFPEFVALPIDWNMILYGATFAAGAAGLASVFAYENQRNVDVDVVKNRVAELERLPSRTLEQNDELAALYAAWATTLYDMEEAELDEIVDVFGKAEAILTATLAQGDDERTRKQLGTVYLSWGAACNGFDDLESAIDIYEKATEVLKPLEDAADAEAKYDVAGIKLSLGIACREIGEFAKAKKYLDESFLAYRAVEKISDDDTRFYMATVSVQQGNLLYEMGEPLDSVVDAYNRAMRLYVEVIEDQKQVELERNLANVLLDRSMVTYEHWLNQKFECEEERKKTIDAVLLDISRGIDLLEKQYNEGNEAARYDMFHAIALQGRALCDAEQFEEALVSLDRAVNEFADIAETSSDILMEMVMICHTRAIAHLGLGKQELSKQDCHKGSELIDKLLQLYGDEEDIQELKEQFQELLGHLE